MKNSKGDLTMQFKIALVVPAFLVLITGGCSIFFAASMAGKLISAMLTIIAVCSILAVMVGMSKRIAEKESWFTDILDAIPFPISVTDENMNWTFINKPVENLLNTKRADLLGKHCSNWGAGICKTEQCGIACLKRNILETTFEQMGMTFKVDTAYLHDKSGRVIGHIEVVQDISKLSNIKQLETLLNQIEKICPVLSSGANQVSSSSQALAQGATEQAAVVDELSCAVKVISNQVNDNAKNAQKANSMASQATTSIQSSNQQMQQLMSSMNVIEAKSHEISKIIKTIEDIAFQTNILALNAAVEAARAGAAGKGFAVVADEVRNLAAKSADAAKNTTTLIEDSVSSIVQGVRLAGITASELNNAVQTVITTTDVISEITKASGEQADAVSQVSIGINRISSVVQANAANSEETAAASEELFSQAALLRQLTQRFKMNGDAGQANVPSVLR